MKKNANELSLQFGVNILHKYRFILYLIILLICGLSFLGLRHLRMDSSNESFFAEDAEVLKTKDRFKSIFGNEEFLFILLEAEDIFTHDVLKELDAISTDLEKKLPFVEEAISVANVEYTEMQDNFLFTGELVPRPIPNQQEQLDKIRLKAHLKPLLKDRIFGSNNKFAGIFISFEEIPKEVWVEAEKNFSPLKQATYPIEKILLKDKIYAAEDLHTNGKNEGLVKVSDPRKLIAPAIKAILNKFSNSPFKTTAIGVSLLDFEIDRITEKEIEKFGTISLIASCLLLFFLFRSLRALLAPIFVCIATIIMLFGLMGFLDIPITMTSVLIPTLIVVISVSYSIHFINLFIQGFRQHGSRMAGLKYSYLHAGWPCFITALTTATGFAAFTVVPIRPIREVGIVSAIGVFITYLLVMIVVPTIYSMGSDKAISKKDKKYKIENWLSTWADILIRYKKPLALLSLALMVFLLIGSTKIKVKTDFLEFLGSKVDVVKDTSYVTSKLGGFYSYEIMIELPEENMAKEPSVHLGIERLTQFIIQDPSTKLIMSLSDLIKDIYQSLNNNDPSFFKIPENRNAISQLLLLYEISGGEDLEDWVDYNYQTLRVSVQANQMSSDTISIFNEIRRLAKEHFPEGTKITITGDMSLMLKMASIITSGQVNSVLIAFVVISLMFMAITRSIKLGLISMIPNVIPVIFVIGSMGYLGLHLDMLTMMISAIIIGIAVDDTVHFLLHFKEAYEHTHNYESALKECFSKIGKAVVFTSVILIIGFALLGLSQVKSLGIYALFSSVGIFAALAADLVITPIILLIIKPFR